MLESHRGQSIGAQWGDVSRLCLGSALLKFNLEVGPLGQRVLSFQASSCLEVQEHDASRTHWLWVRLTHFF